MFCEHEEFYQADLKPCVSAPARTWTNQYDSRISMRRELTVVQKVRVVRDDDTVIPPGFSEYILIATSDEIDITNVSDVEALTSENIGDPFSHTLIDQKSHSASIFFVHSLYFFARW